MKHDYIDLRVVDEANYMVEQNATIRQTALHSGVSKSAVHVDMSRRLRRINPTLYASVQKILDINKVEAHLRGGESTKSKFMGGQ